MYIEKEKYLVKGDIQYLLSLNLHCLMNKLTFDLDIKKRIKGSKEWLDYLSKEQHDFIYHRIEPDERVMNIAYIAKKDIHNIDDLIEILIKRMAKKICKEIYNINYDGKSKK